MPLAVKDVPAVSFFRFHFVPSTDTPPLARRSIAGKAKSWVCPPGRLRGNTRQIAMDFDFIVVGSGFGGSVSAHRLTEKGYRVGVMEMGCRWTPRNLPATN